MRLKTTTTGLRRCCVGVGCASLVLALPGGAQAAKPTTRPARLAITTISAPPATLKSGSEFTVTGKVANRGGRASGALLAFELRTKAHPKITYALGGGSIASVKPGQTRAFRVKVRLTGTTASAEIPRGFLLAGCVSKARGAARACRKSDGRATVEAPKLVAAPGAGAPPAAPPVTAPVLPPVAPPTTPTTPTEPTEPSGPVDRIAPSTTDDVPTTLQSAAVSVTLAVTDAGGSGVYRTYYTTGTDPADPTTSSTVYDPANRPTLNDGERIKYFSVDVAGNQEAVKTSAAARVDTTAYTPGARTGNDTLFPTIGNGGYDAQHYDLDLDYAVTSKLLKGTATITAVATENLSELSFDLTAWNGVTKVTVDGVRASYRPDYENTKLIVTPATGIKSGTTFKVAVDYGGIQQAYIDPDGSQEGWVPSTTYGAIVVSEPVGAMGWFPNNNVPFDKATYTTKLTVPYGWSVVGTGVLKTKTDTGTTPTDKSTFVWDETDPTASYLYSVAVGKYDLSSPDPAAPTMTTPAVGSLNTPIPFYTAVDSSFTTGKATMLTNLGRTPSILDYFSDYYGVKYPFTSSGGIVPRQSVSYSLETQSKPIYATSTSATSTGAGISTIAHENGHMWFGDMVTLTQWKDIWLNEGMTEFSSWLWQANVNSGTAMTARYASNYTNSTSTSYWRVPTANPPTAADIFDTNAMYNRGATTMEAIHEIIADDAKFRAMMKRWLTEHAYGNATTEQFIALVKQTDPGRAARWTEFFRQWLYTSYTGSPAAGNKPAMNVENFDSYVLPAP